MVKLKKSGIRLTTGDFILMFVVALLVLITILPFMNLLSLSMSSNKAILQNKGMIFPKEFSLVAYQAILSSEKIYVSFFMTILITLTCTLIHVAVTILSGYVLSIKGLPFRKGMMLYVLLTMIFSGGLVPTYLVISMLGMIDTFWAMTIPGVVSAYSIFLMKNFMTQIPSELKEAAFIDGAGPVVTLWKIIVPLSVPIISTITLFCAVGKWNDWFSALVYIKEARIFLPIQTILQSLVVNGDTGENTGIHMSDFSEGFQSALIVVSIIPVIVIYPFVQKYFVKGIFMGSVKE